MNGLIYAHVSDLHLGRDDECELMSRAIAQRLRAVGVHHVLVTGDVTHRGREDEYDLFLDCFASWFETEQITVVPGNHDRQGDDVARKIADNQRIWTVGTAGLNLVCFDSTGEQNRNPVTGHGTMSHEDISAIVETCAAQGDKPVALLLHHHVIPLPVDHWGERLAEWMRLPFTAELELGLELIEQAVPHCDLMLHGHRHRPAAVSFDRRPSKPTQLLNAGSSVEVRQVRLIPVTGEGEVGIPFWLPVDLRTSGWVESIQSFGMEGPTAFASSGFLV